VTAVKLRLERLSQAVLTGLCGTETNTLLTALAGTYTKLNCPINAASWVIDFSATSRQYKSLCLEMGGQLFVIANKTAACDRAEVNGTNTSYFFSESNVYYSFAASCTHIEVMGDNPFIQDN
jgi:hypothetical protein